MVSDYYLVGQLIVANLKNMHAWAIQSPYQWMEMLFWTWLTTLIRSVSPSLATIRGPGNCPFTVTMLFVWHNRVTFSNLIYKTRQSFNNIKEIKTKKKHKQM